MKIDGDDVTLSSGRRLYANNGIIGLDPKLDVYEGYDGCLIWQGDGWTADERRELADYMIEQWQQFRAQS